MRPLGGQKPVFPSVGESSRVSRYKDPSFRPIGNSSANVALPFGTSNTASAPNRVESSNMDFGLPRQNLGTFAQQEGGAPKTRIDIPDRAKLKDMEKPVSSTPQQALANKNSKKLWVDTGKKTDTGLSKNLSAMGGSKSPLGDNDKTLPVFKNYLDAREGQTYKDPNAGNPIYYNRFGSVVQPMALPGQERGAYPILSIQGLGTQNVPPQAFDLAAPLIDLSSPKKSPATPSLEALLASKGFVASSNAQPAPSAPPLPAEMLHLMDADITPPQQVDPAKKLEEFVKSEILVPFSEGTQRPLPLLVDRHKTMGGNGDKVIDGSNFYEWDGYQDNYYNLGVGLNKVLDGLRPYLSKEGGSPQKPARAFLEKYKVGLQDLDTHFSRNSNNFVLNDYTYDDMNSLYKTMNDISIVMDKTQKFQKKTETGEVVEEESFEDYLKKLPVPQAEHVALTKPFNETMQDVLTKLPAIGKTYKSLTEKPSSGYIERVLLIKKFAQDMKNSVTDVSKSPEAQDPAHREAIGKFVDSGKKFVKSLEDVISYVETTPAFKSAHVEVGLEKIDASYEAFQKQINNISDALGEGKFGDLEETNHDKFLNPYIHIATNIFSMMNGPLGEELGCFMMRKLIKEEEAKTKEEATAAKKASSPEVKQPSASGGGAGSPPPSPPSSPKKEDNKIPPEKKEKTFEDYKVLSSEEAYRKYLQSLPKPEDMTRPLADKEIQRPAVFDDSSLREIQQMSEWADYANKMSQKLKLLDNIGNTVQDLAMLGTSRPDPEYVALARRWRRLSDLLDVAREVPKCNKMTQQIEQASLEAQHDYIRGVGTLLTARLKSRTEEAQQKIKLDQMAARGAVNLAASAMETELLLSKHAEKIFNMFMQIQDMRDMNTWDRIKHLVKAFKW